VRTESHELGELSGPGALQKRRRTGEETDVAPLSRWRDVRHHDRLYAEVAILADRVLVDAPSWPHGRLPKGLGGQEAHLGCGVPTGSKTQSPRSFRYPASREIPRLIAEV
jgi:hypothetical protein